MEREQDIYREIRHGVGIVGLSVAKEYGFNVDGFTDFNAGIVALIFALKEEIKELKSEIHTIKYPTE